MRYIIQIKKCWYKQTGAIKPMETFLYKLMSVVVDSSILLTYSVLMNIDF